MLFIIATLLFASISLLSFELLRPRERTVAQRAGAIRRSGAGVRHTEGSVAQRLLRPAAGRWGARLASILPANAVRSVDRMLIQANEPWSLPGFLFVWALCVLGGSALFAYVVRSNPSLTALQIVLYAVLFLPLAFLLPYAALRHKVRRRQKAIVRALPDAMDLLVTSVEAGLGVDAAFALVADKTTGPMSETVSFYLRQVGLGRGRREALTLAAENTGVADLIGIAHSVSQAEQLGTTLGDVLRAQSRDLRMTRRRRAQAAAQRAPVLMTIPMALCFLPAMGAVVMVPSVLNLLRFVGSLGE